MPGISKMTVYNALNLLVQKGLAQSLAFDGEKMQFDGDASEHIHFKCQKCGKIFDFPCQRSPQAQELPEGFSILRTQVTVFGLCSDCSPCEKTP